MTVQNVATIDWDTVGQSHIRLPKVEMNTMALSVAECATAPPWFAIQTKYQYEKQVAAQLQGKGVEVYLPLRREKHGWSDREQAITIPLFPGYAFVRPGTSAEARLRILQTAGFKQFVSVRGVASSVLPKEIEDLRTLLKEEVPFSLYPFLDVGRRVRIRGGCLHGVEGVLLTHEKDKLLISIASIQRALVIQVQGYELEMV